MASPKNSLGMMRFRARTDDAPSTSGSRLRAVRDFGANPGALAMKAYSPAGLAPGAPLVVVLHGCTQLAGGFEASAGWMALADEHRFALLYPEQRRVNNPKLCFSWFQSENVTRGRGEVASIRQMIATMIVRHKLDEARVFVTGLSAGGAMANAMLAAYPEVFAGGSIVAGLPYGAAASVPDAFSAMYQGRRRTPEECGDLVRAASSHRGPWPKVVVWHGAADKTVVPQNAEETVKQWADIHGLTLADMRETVDGRLTRRRWGEGQVEAYLIAGMEHGVPLDAKAGEKPGPFMLDVGISQARTTLAFWGLASGGADAIRAAVKSAPAAKPAPELAPISAPPRPSARTPEPRAERRAGRSGFAGRMDQSPRAPEKRGVDVEAVIKKALRAAGLMK